MQDTDEPTDERKVKLTAIPGVYRGMPDDEYRAIPAVSQSTLKRFYDCPQKFKLSPPIEPTANMIYGSLVDALWLTGDVSKFAVQPATYEGLDRKKMPVQKKWSNNADFCKDWCELQEAQGKEVVSAETFAMAQAAVARLNATTEIREVRDNCDVQVAVVAEIEGIMCKGLIDLCPRDGMRMGLGDLKTAQSANPAGWSRYCFNMRLHWQAAMYLDLWNLATGEGLEHFFHFVSEQAPPHEPCMMALSPEFIAMGRDEYRRALRRYQECVTSGVWPGYPSGAVIGVEKWMLNRPEIE